MKVFQTVGRYVFSTGMFREITIYAINIPEADLEYRIANTSIIIILDNINTVLNPRISHETRWRVE